MAFLSVKQGMIQIISNRNILEGELKNLIDGNVIDASNSRGLLLRAWIMNDSLYVAHQLGHDARSDHEVYEFDIPKGDCSFMEHRSITSLCQFLSQGNGIPAAKKITE